VLAGLALVVAMPWNLPLWWQFARLRMAIEMDCDGRVLRRERDARAYGALLLEVGRRRSRRGLVVAFSEPRIFLERRIRQITARATRGGRRRILGFSALAVLALGGAFCARDPLAPRNAAETTASLAPAPVVDIAERPVFTPMTVRPRLENPAQVGATLRRNYPPLLRDAGIEGKAVVWFLIDETGKVRKTQINESSGYEALDEAALRVAGTMEFTPALNRDVPVTVWVQMPVAFSRTAGGDDQAMPAMPSSARQARPMPADTPPGRLLPTPAPAAAGSADRPVFTPMTVRPTLTNVADVSRALETNYPPLLNDAGIGGTAIVWFFIDETGRVQRTQLAKSSGYEALDQAALSVASAMRYTPAYNRDERVAVWVQIPITFGRQTSAAADAMTRRSLVPTPADNSTGRTPTAPPARTRSEDVLRKLTLTNPDEISRELQRNYPPLLRDAGIGGTVIVWAYVDVAGRITRLQLNRSSGYEALDQAAMLVAAKVRFEPAVDGSTPIATWTEIPFSFHSK
jgi:TonB family protein